MKALVILKGKLREVEAPPQYEVMAAREVAAAESRLKTFLESWPTLPTQKRGRCFQLAIFDTVTVAVADSAKGSVWVDALAKLRAMKKRELWEIVTYRCRLIRNLAVLTARRPKETEAELCKIMTLK